MPDFFVVLIRMAGESLVTAARYLCRKEISSTLKVVQNILSGLREVPKYLC
jgi:hypothetical protein